MLKAIVTSFAGLVGELIYFSICVDASLSTLRLEMSRYAKCCTIEEGLSHRHICFFSGSLSNSELTKTDVATTQSMTRLLTDIATRSGEYWVFSCWPSNFALPTNVSALSFFRIGLPAPKSGDDMAD